MADISISGHVAARQEMAEKLKAAIEGGHPNAIILAFWAAFPWEQCQNAKCTERRRCWEGGCLTASKRLELLRAMASINIHPDKQWERNRKVRRDFESQWGFPDESKPCFVCGEPYNHRHHILQIQHGGHNSPRNVVLLCRDCHKRVHGKT